MIVRGLALSAFALLAACSTHDAKDNVTASIDVSGNSLDGSVVAITSDSDTGKMSLKVPGFEAKLDMPAGIVGNSNFDIDGVKLYPGSKVTAVNVNASGDDHGSVRIGFDAPATPQVVKTWFAKAFSDRGMTVTQSVEGLAGVDKDGSPFALAFEAKGPAATTGHILMQDKDAK